MGIYLAEQTIAFLQAMIVGAAMGILYDLFRISRIAIPTARVVVIVEDILYFSICAVATFLLMMSSLDGQVRIFVLMGQLIGAILYFCTVGRLVMKISRTIINIVRGILRFIFRWILRPIWITCYRIVRILLLPIYFIMKIIRKLCKRLKFRLKMNRTILYNHFSARLKKTRCRKKTAGDGYA